MAGICGWGKRIAAACALLLSYCGAMAHGANLTVATANLFTGQVTLQITSEAPGAGSLTLLKGSGVACGTAAQTAGGKDASGATAYGRGSFTLTSGATSSYTLRNLAQSSAYTVCVTDGTTTPVSASFTTKAVTMTARAWTAVGSGDFTNPFAKEYSLAVAPDGTPYFAYADCGINDNDGCVATVKKYSESSGWTLVGAAGFSGGAVGSLSLAFAPDGTLYLAYYEASSTKATVMRYDTANGWTPVGSTGFSNANVNPVRLAIAPDGTPYVSYGDGSNSEKATVMRYETGSGWTPVGTAGFSSANSYYESLAIAADGTPYLAYQDGATSKAVVMRYDTINGWAAVGTNNVSPDGCEYERLAIAPDGTLYLACTDTAHDGQVVVARYSEQSGWSMVGPANFSAEASLFLNMVIGADGVPYVAYVETYNLNTVSVMRYDATNGWTRAGAAGFPLTATANPAMAISPEGTPLLAFPNCGISQNLGCFARVKRFLAEPSVVTKAASGITADSATLNGEGDGNGEAASFRFEYGTSSSYGSQVSASTVGGASGSSTAGGTGVVAATVDIGGLLPNKIYHFRLDETNDAGTAYGADQSFTTAKATPTVSVATSNSSVLYGTSVSWTATLVPAAATGTVSFSTGSATLGSCTLSGGSCSMSSSALAANSYSILAVYSGDGSYNSALGSVSQTVTAPVTTPTLSTVSPAYAAAGGAALTLSVTGSNFSSGSTVYFGTTALVTSFVSSTQLTATVPAALIAAEGISPVAVATSGSSSGVLYFSVNSANGAAYAPTLTTATVTVAAGETASYSVTVPEAASNVGVTCLNLPAGSSCSYSAGKVSISTSSITPAGSYSVTLVFRETISVTTTAWLVLPILLLPLYRARKRLGQPCVWLAGSVAVVLLSGVLALSGCGSSPAKTVTTTNTTNTITSSGTVTLVVK